MFEKALTGSKKYYLWLGLLLAVIGNGVFTYMKQYEEGLAITGLSRDITWGIYISQLTYLVGVAAGAVMLVLPYYLHHYKKFKDLIIFGEFLAVPAILMCMLFVIVDLGQPTRFANVLLHPTPNSILFWDAMVLQGYLLINIVVGWVTLEADKLGTTPPKWIKFLTYVSIPFAFSIHTVTAFIYAGNPGRHLWLTAIMAPRFLASAFAAGPSILLILLMILKKVTKFKPEEEAIQTLGKIITYGMIANLFFFALEGFTAFYSNIPSHMHSLQYLFVGHGEANKLVPYMWTSVILGIIGIAIIIKPSMRANQMILTTGAVLIVVSTWIDKGLGLVIGGFIPSPMETYREYTVTNPEMFITFGIYGVGLLVLTLLYKMAITIKEEKEI